MEAQSSDMSLNESLDDTHSFLEMELEALQSIYINEIEVERDVKSTTVSIVLHPATADKLEEQYVRMTLQFLLEDGYPEDIPQIKIRNPRGLSDEKLNCIMNDLLAISESKRGNSMLFEMIEAAKEHLTTGNRPSGECAICLYGFSDNDVFTKTECYHYFHSHCLARYKKNFMENSEDYEMDPKSKSLSNELLCPMCRIPIQFSGYEDSFPPPEASDEDIFILTEEIVELQRKMADLYQKQVEKGGIIDIEAEKNKYLIEISNVPTRTSNEEKLEHKSNADSSVTAEQDTESSDQIDSPSKDVKEHHRDQTERSDYRGKNRNFNRQNESRGNFRGRYNKQPYNDYRGKYNRNKYDRYAQKSDSNHGNFRRNDNSDHVVESTDTAVASVDADREDLTDSVSHCDGASENAETSDVKSKRFSNYSPKYNRGYHRDTSPRYNRGYRRANNYRYNSRYDGGRRSDKSNFEENTSAQAFRKHNTGNAEGDDVNKSEDRDQRERTYDYGNRKPNYGSDNYKHNDFSSKERYERSISNEKDMSKFKEQDHKDRTSDYSTRKSNYQSDNFRQDKDYNSRERYSDNRSSPRGGRGGYGKRGNYSHDSNYSGRNRYADYDKDHYYTDRDRNYRGRRTPTQGRYKSDNTDGYRQKSSRNYSANSYVKPTDGQSLKDENHESVPGNVSNETDNASMERENLGNVSDSRKSCESSERKNKAHVEKNVSGFDRNNAKKLIDKAAPASDGNGLNLMSSVMSEKPQGSLRTALNPPNPPPGFANPLKKVIYGLQGANPPPGFNRS